MKKSNLTLRAICEGAILIAAATVLSLVPIWKMPQGGSFDLAMLPIIIFCVRWGIVPSLAAGFVSVSYTHLLTPARPKRCLSFPIR